MLGTFAPFAKFFFKFDPVSIDNNVFRLHYKVMMIIIMMMMILLQASEKWDMPSFKDRFWMQLGGYVFVITGMFLYSDVIIMPYIRQRRADKKISQDAS